MALPSLDISHIFPQASRIMVMPQDPEPDPGQSHDHGHDSDASLQDDGEDIGLESELCMHCVTPHDPTADFCRKCGAPLTTYASTLPFERTLAEGFAYRQAVENPRKFVVVAGMWMIFIPMALIGVGLIGMPLQEGVAMDALMIGKILSGCAFIIVSMILIVRTTWNYFHRREESRVDG